MATESQFTISPPNCSAIASERAVLPLPVGPTMATSRGSTHMPVDISPIANQNDDEPEQQEDKDADGFGAQHGAFGLLRAALRRDHGSIVSPKFVTVSEGA